MTTPNTTMYDSTDPTAVPPNSPLLAGYINGKYQSYYDMAANNPMSTVLKITVKAHNSDGSYVQADILDIENGDATPDEAPGWTQAMRDLHRSIIAPYCSRLGTWPDTQAAFVSQHVTPPDYWVADQTGQPHLVPGSVATQWTDTGPYDISLTNGTWPLSGVVPPAPPPITTYLVGALTMHVVAVQADKNGNGWVPTNILWSSFQAATIGGADPSPTADDEYWPGYAQVQNRNGTVLVCIIGCIPLTVRNVFVLTTT